MPGGDRDVLQRLEAQHVLHRRANAVVDPGAGPHALGAGDVHAVAGKPVGWLGLEADAIGVERRRPLVEGDYGEIVQWRHAEVDVDRRPPELLRDERLDERERAVHRAGSGVRGDDDCRGFARAHHEDVVALAAQPRQLHPTLVRHEGDHWVR